MSEERKIRWKTLRIQGLRQRWVFNSIMPVLLMPVSYTHLTLPTIA